MAMVSRLINPVLVTRFKVLAFIVCLLPGFMLAIRAFNNQLGANPIEAIERSLGYWTLALLMITLTVTPLRFLLGWPWLIRLRRMFGLFTFFYACLHFLAYVGLDNFFDWSTILGDLVKRPYISVGFPAFILLIPLAITSTQGMIRRLGYPHWQRLHRLVYIIAIGGVVHYWWLVKKDLSDPIKFAVVLTVLFAVRILNALTVNRRGRRQASTRT